MGSALRRLPGLSGSCAPRLVRRDDALREVRRRVRDRVGGRLLRLASVLPPFFGPGLWDSHGCLSAVQWQWFPVRSSTAGSDLGGSVVVEARVRSGLVVGAPVLLDQDRGFAHREERLLVQALVPETTVKD